MEHLRVVPLARGCKSLIALPEAEMACAEPEPEPEDDALTPLQRLAVVLFASAIIALGSVVALLLAVVA